jgi:shikimate dehydrogenase
MKTIKGDTKVYGIVGYPVEHSLSPVFQNRAFEYMGLRAVYVPFPVKAQELEVAIAGLRALGVEGINITIPHKEKALELMDEVSEDARLIGAVNTVSFSDRVVGYNTDWLGFKRSLEEVIEPSGKRALVLGAGGSSRAVVYALTRMGVNTVIWNRTPSKARKLAEEFGLELTDRPENVIGEVDIVVNTTSVGLFQDDTELFDYSLLRPEHTVVDIIYRDTPLVKRAKEMGATAINGFPMLLYQGIESFKIWTGCEPPVEPLKQVLRPFGYPS